MARGVPLKYLDDDQPNEIRHPRETDRWTGGPDGGFIIRMPPSPGIQYDRGAVLDRPSVQVSIFLHRLAGELLAIQPVRNRPHRCKDIGQAIACEKIRHCSLGNTT
ncbi:hypothetical protein TrispH2_002395 [Trichoplax sp. H2]|nr:hypothetical protein TrispH2_002395 [Trichoplax sp. H2]|eukprot:RDD44860.1 hypothetical protein TrispH2_002395 [Trichoplax sp. H2]